MVLEFCFKQVKSLTAQKTAGSFMEPDPSLRSFEITGTGGFFCFGIFVSINGTGGYWIRKVGSLNNTGIRGFFLSGWLGTRVPGTGGY